MNPATGGGLPHLRTVPGAAEVAEGEAVAQGVGSADVPQDNGELLRPVAIGDGLGGEAVQWERPVAGVSQRVQRPSRRAFMLLGEVHMARCVPGLETALGGQ